MAGYVFVQNSQVSLNFISHATHLHCFTANSVSCWPRGYTKFIMSQEKKTLRLQSFLQGLYGKLFPKGFLDGARQIIIFMAAYQLYRFTRGAADETQAVTVAFENGRNVIDLERTLGIFIEPTVQAFTESQNWLMGAASWLYINAQTSITIGALTWIYIFHNRSFYYVRNMFIVAFGIALIGYTIFPTAPPRFFPEWGFIDSVSNFVGIESDDTAVNALFNPYAAIPSMHVGFAIMIAIPLSMLVKNRALKIFWSCYPLLVVFVIVATANHFLIDAFLGLATAATGAYAARILARVRPKAWEFSPRRASAAVHTVRA